MTILCVVQSTAFQHQDCRRGSVEGIRVATRRDRVYATPRRRAAWYSSWRTGKDLNLRNDCSPSGSRVAAQIGAFGRSATRPRGTSKPRGCEFLVNYRSCLRGRDVTRSVDLLRCSELATHIGMLQTSDDVADMRPPSYQVGDQVSDCGTVTLG